MTAFGRRGATWADLMSSQHLFERKSWCSQSVLPGSTGKVSKSIGYHASTRAVSGLSTANGNVNGESIRVTGGSKSPAKRLSRRLVLSASLDYAARDFHFYPATRPVNLRNDASRYQNFSSREPFLQVYLQEENSSAIVIEDEIHNTANLPIRCQ